MLKYKAIINDGFRLPFGEALKLENVCSLITIQDHMTNQAPVNMQVHNAAAAASFFFICYGLTYGPLGSDHVCSAPVT